MIEMDKNELIKLLIDCDEEKYGIKNHEDMSPSSSIREIAEFIDSHWL